MEEWNLRRRRGTRGAGQRAGGVKAGQAAPSTGSGAQGLGVFATAGEGAAAAIERSSLPCTSCRLSFLSLQLPFPSLPLALYVLHCSKKFRQWAIMIPNGGPCLVSPWSGLRISCVGPKGMAQVPDWLSLLKDQFLV